MNRKITIALFSAVLILSGCAKKTEKSVSSTAKPKASAKASKSPVPEKSAQPTESTAPVKTASPAQNTNTNNSQGTPAQNNSTNNNAQVTPTGTWQITSYDNGSGDKETFNPGKDSSIMGSSTIVLNQDGSCEFNLPGMSSGGCTWSGTDISTGGATITYSLSGNEMTVKNADGTYTFQKAQ